jgi:hypothetical protein
VLTRCARNGLHVSRLLALGIKRASEWRHLQIPDGAARHVRANQCLHPDPARYQNGAVRLQFSRTEPEVMVQPHTQQFRTSIGSRDSDIPAGPCMALRRRRRASRASAHTPLQLLKNEPDRSGTYLLFAWGSAPSLHTSISSESEWIDPCSVQQKRRHRLIVAGTLILYLQAMRSSHPASSCPAAVIMRERERTGGLGPAPCKLR